jgi:hypothetical protein
MIPKTTTNGMVFKKVGQTFIKSKDKIAAKKDVV